MYRAILTGVLSLLLALTLVPSPSLAADDTAFSVPVRSYGYWRNQHYSADSYFDRFIQKVTGTQPEVTTYQFAQCRRWDMYESKFSLYSAGSQAVHTFTFTAGPLNGCTMFRSETTAADRLATCQAFCALGSCVPNDCATATVFDGFWTR